VPLAVVTLGDDGNAVPDPIDAPPLTVDVAPVAPRPVRLPLLVDAQSEGALPGEDVAAWVEAASAVGSSARSRVDPPWDAPDEPIEAVILRRGSTRVMRPDPIDADRLRWPMAAATRAAPLDAAEGTLLEHFVNVHGVDRLTAGAYRWVGTDVELVGAADEARRAGEALCLGQRLGGDSAYTVFHHADLDPILDALGSRGYRAAQLEAGIASGRLALAAFAVGLGATGLTFLDDPVSAYFGTSTAPLLVTAVGPSATPPARGGPPGQPVHLRRWGML
jgi:nitroreductase